MIGSIVTRQLITISFRSVPSCSVLEWIRGLLLRATNIVQTHVSKYQGGRLGEEGVGWRKRSHSQGETSGQSESVWLMIRRGD